MRKKSAQTDERVVNPDAPADRKRIREERKEMVERIFD